MTQFDGLETFVASYIITDSGCWSRFIVSRTPWGYGILSFNGVPVSRFGADRLSWPELYMSKVLRTCGGSTYAQRIQGFLVLSPTGGHGALSAFAYHDLASSIILDVVEDHSSPQKEKLVRR